MVDRKCVDVIDRHPGGTDRHPGRDQRPAPRAGHYVERLGTGTLPQCRLHGRSAESERDTQPSRSPSHHGTTRRPSVRSRFATWIDAGVIGDGSDQMVDRLQRDVVEQHPNMVVTLAGTNDCHPTPGNLPWKFSPRLSSSSAQLQSSDFH
jgi:hypothetical protein